MSPLATGASAAVGLAVFSWVVWRLASQRWLLPCPHWLGWIVELDNPLARENRATAIVGHLGLAPGMSVLDIGCGPGRLTLPLAQAVGPTGMVTAIDVQPEMLERMMVKARSAMLENIVTVQATVGTGSLVLEPVDRAVLVTVLGEIPDREAAMREIFTILGPKGILSVTETVFDPHYLRREVVAELAIAAGFRVAASFGNRIAYTLHLQRDGEMCV